MKPRCTSTYLYGSRQAWLLPSLTAVTAEEITRVLPPAFDVKLTPRTALARFSVEPSEVSDSLARAGIASHDWDRPVDERDLGALRDHIVSDRDLSALIR